MKSLHHDCDMKMIIDEYHKAFIESILNDFKFHENEGKKKKVETNTDTEEVDIDEEEFLNEDKEDRSIATKVEEDEF